MNRLSRVRRIPLPIPLLFRIAAACALLFATAAGAADVQVIATGALSGALKTIALRYEQDTGNHLVLSSGPSLGSTPDAIPVRIERRQPVDVLIMVAPAMDKLIGDGRFVAAARVDIAQSGIGVGVRAGHPAPDVSTVVALRQALLDAKSIGYSQGASGAYITGTLFGKLGIADEVAGKGRQITGGGLVGGALVRGDVELGLQQISELRVVPGVTYVGPLPAELQQVSDITAAVADRAVNPEGAADFLRYLRTAPATQALETSGLDLPTH